MKEETEEIRRTRVRMIERCVLMDNTFRASGAANIFSRRQSSLSAEGGGLFVSTGGSRKDGKA
jgi:hypothetical protein